MRGDLMDLIQPLAKGGRESRSLVLSRPARAQCGTQVIIGDPLRAAVKPPDIINGNALREICGALPLISPCDDAIADAANQILIL